MPSWIAIEDINAEDQELLKAALRESRHLLRSAGERSVSAAYEPQADQWRAIDLATPRSFALSFYPCNMYVLTKEAFDALIPSFLGLCFICGSSGYLEALGVEIQNRLDKGDISTPSAASRSLISRLKEIAYTASSEIALVYPMISVVSDPEFELFLETLERWLEGAGA